MFKKLDLTPESMAALRGESLEKMNVGEISWLFNKLINHMEFANTNLPYVDSKKCSMFIRTLWKCKGIAQGIYWNSTDLKHSEEIYYNNVYRELRSKVFNLHPKECMKCGSVANLQLDHIKPVSKHPNLFLDIDNMQILCKKCNQEKSNLHETDYRK